MASKCIHRLITESAPHQTWVVKTSINLEVVGLKHDSIVCVEVLKLAGASMYLIGNGRRPRSLEYHKRNHTTPEGNTQTVSTVEINRHAVEMSTRFSKYYMFCDLGTTAGVDGYPLLL